MGIEAGVSRTKLRERLQAERDPDVLGEFITHPAWQVRWAAIESLGEVESPAAERFLLRVLATSREDGDLVLANAALGKVGTQAAIPALAQLIHHHVDDVKCSAISALSLLGDSSLTPVYLDALSDRSWVAKWYAVMAIHRNGDERAIGPVADRLRSVLGRERRTLIGGWSEVMYGLDFLRRWPEDDTASSTIAWVRARLHRLQPDERNWFESTFGSQTG